MISGSLGLRHCVTNMNIIIMGEYSHFNRAGCFFHGKFSGQRGRQRSERVG